MQFSANLGFLWQDRPLPDRIIAAGQYGFNAVECHFPYDTPVEEVRSALNSSKLEMISINTWIGRNGADDFGVAARPDRVEEAREIINQAVSYAVEICAKHVSVLPGKLGRTKQAEIVFCENLSYACELAAKQGIGILIEPINTHTVPGFYLHTLEQALATLDAVGSPDLRILFDCFHIQIMQGNLLQRISSHLSEIGHIQFASVPDRAEPDSGEINYQYLLNAVLDAGWQGCFGAEYHPKGKTEDSLDWMRSIQ